MSATNIKSSAAAAVLQNDKAIFYSRGALVALVASAAAPALRGYGEAKLIAQLTSADPQQGLRTALATFLLTETLAPKVASAVRDWSTRSWQADALHRYDAAYLANEGDRPSLWAMGGQVSTATQSVRQVRTNLFAQRLYWGVYNEVKAVVGVAQAGVSLAYSALWFVQLLGKNASAALFVGVVLGCSYRFLRLPGESQRTENARHADREIAGHRARAWDNITLGNVNNQRRWLKTHDSLLAQQRSLETAEKDHKLASTATEHLLALLPLTAFFYSQLLQAGSSEAHTQRALTTLLTLPVAFRAAKEATSISHLVTASFLPARKSLLERTLTPARAVPGCDFDQIIDFHNIFVLGKDGSKISLLQAQDSLISAARKNLPGLFEIRGGNGLGKSLFLLKLKELLNPESAALLPVERGSLLFESSTGSASEAILNNFESLVQSGTPVLLLDEVEATLDKSTRGNFRARLEQLTQSKENGGAGRTIFLISHV